MKTANDLQLNQMVLETIMGLADQNHPPVGECGNQRLQIRKGAEVHNGRRGDRALLSFGNGVLLHGMHRMMSGLRRGSAGDRDQQRHQCPEANPSPRARHPLSNR